MRRHGGWLRNTNDEGRKLLSPVALAGFIFRWKSVALLLMLSAGVWAQDTCVECHSALDDSPSSPAILYASDVHADRGFACVDCHGGDNTSDDMSLAMSPARGFRGAVDRAAIPQLCGRCHSDASLMHEYDPSERVDQLAQYRTSVHGQRLAAGDENVATCIDCHSVHNIREVSDGASPVYPLNLPDTCARCHADAALMEEYGLSATQYEQYQQSVHWAALSERGDLSAPNCATCHGNHGATPPQVNSVAAVCGTCHVLQENFYRESPHQAVFELMGMAGCVTCHGNHEVMHPTDGLLAGDEAVCSRCHEADSAGGQVAQQMGEMISGLDSQLNEGDALLEEARLAGMEVSEALLRQRDGRESLVMARVAVHAFDPDAVSEHITEGQAIAQETQEAGTNALRESGVRRRGLVVSLVAIFITMIGLWLAIRWFEKKPEQDSVS